MKKSIALLMLTFGSIGFIMAQTDKNEKKVVAIATEGQPKAVFDKTEHDFGNIKEGTQATVEFAFKNTGKAPLVLTSVQASCGCTTPTWTRDPIAPGATGKITAVYNSSGRPGNFTKMITVKHNGEGEDGTAYLTIKGIVEPAPVEPASPVKTTN